eukprot:jgi/Tetstr1/454210/TSEL_041129.t1
MSTVGGLLGDTLASRAEAMTELDAIRATESVRSAGAAAGLEIACAGDTCLRAGASGPSMLVCRGGECAPVEGGVTCPGADQAWDGTRCAPVGSPCDPPPSNPDAATQAFVIDAAGRCLATTDCKQGLAKHPEDQRCVTDCGNNRIFSYVMNACVGVGALCGDGPDNHGFLAAFDEAGRCARIDACAPGHMRHPRDATRCVPVCAGGTRFSDTVDACVAEGDPCPPGRGAHDATGACRLDGAPCQSTMFPDTDTPALRASAAQTSERLNGAVLEFRDGVCRPTGGCASPAHMYAWRRGGCVPEQTGIACPEGFTKTSDTTCTMTRNVGGEGSGRVTVKGVNPSHRIRAEYTFRKQRRYTDGDYTVSGPGNSGGARGIRDQHRTVGRAATGNSEYTYSWRNNDGTGSFTWSVEA